MRSITTQLTDELEKFVGNQPVAKADAFPVSSYRELVQKVARLAYLNKDNLLFYRGQDRDYRNKAGASTLYPSIYRGDRLSKSELELRFDFLISTSRRLCNKLEQAGVDGHRDVRRRRYIQWSILQHYELCPTPLLDLTHSLIVACSFAFLSSNQNDTYVFVCGLPYVSNRIAINSEHDIVNVRLLSICPPDALRPFFQDGYLAGTDEITNNYESKDELDFNNRLIAKFRLRRERSFWGQGFSPIPREALYPSGDRIDDICNSIQVELDSEVEPVRLGNFLQEWTDLETLLLSVARRHKEKVLSLRGAVAVLYRAQIINREFVERIDLLRKIRNKAVHEPKRISPHDLSLAIEEISQLRSLAKQIKL